MRKFVVGKEMPAGAAEELGEYPEFLRMLLFHRDIETREDAQKFLNPSYECDSNDPFLMHDMQKAAERIVRAVRNGERIAVFGDYDCDGIPASVILHDFFRKIGYENFSNYIPHRHLEGYGLNVRALERFARDGVSVIVTVDCGIVDFEQADAARELGLDLIITDHHLPGERVPNAYAVVNPKLGKYPDPMLCGAGVAFKLVQALLKIGDFAIVPEGWEKWLLDMAGLSTIADMVPLRNENRMIAYYGLKVLRKSPRIGFRKLLEKMRISQENLTEDDIGFMIAPRVNAASRMDVPFRAFELLSTSDEKVADTLALHLNTLNDRRKGVVASMVKEAKRILEDRKLGEVIVTGNPKWHPGLLGLTASSIMEHFNRPAFVWGRDEEGRIKGSCRSDGSVSVVELMARTSEYFTQFGGHEASGGFMVPHEHIHILEDKLSLAYGEMEKAPSGKGEAVFIDAKITLDDASWENYKMIELLAPFGQGNPKPVFLFENIRIESVREFGKTGTHLEFVFKNSKGAPVKAVLFFAENGVRACSKSSPCLKTHISGCKTSSRTHRNAITFRAPTRFSPKNMGFQTRVPRDCEQALNENGEKHFAGGQVVTVAASLEKDTFRRHPELRLRVVDIS